MTILSRALLLDSLLPGGLAAALDSELFDHLSTLGDDSDCEPDDGDFELTGDDEPQAGEWLISRWIDRTLFVGDGGPPDAIKLEDRTLPEPRDEDYGPALGGLFPPIPVLIARRIAALAPGGSEIARLAGKLLEALT